MAEKDDRSIAEKYAEAAKALKATEEELEIQKWGLQKTNEAINSLYKELAEKNKMLQELDQLKSNFLSMVSHELQAPLTIIKGYTRLLLDEASGKLTSEQREYEELVITNINRLSRMINDLLNIAKIEAKKIELKKSSVSIIELAEEVTSGFKISTGKKNIELAANFPPSRLDISLDRDKIIQVLTNLLDNAIKFTPINGRITVSIVDKKNEVECTVTDTGVGIAAKDLDKVFKKFQQFNRTADPGSQGTGLGLAISKEFILMHNGKIWVDSEPGKGAAFTFTLPKTASVTPP